MTTLSLPHCTHMYHSLHEFKFLERGKLIFQIVPVQILRLWHSNFTNYASQISYFLSSEFPSGVLISLNCYCFFCFLLSGRLPLLSVFLSLITLKKCRSTDFPDGPMAKALSCQGKRHKFDSWSEH